MVGAGIDEDSMTATDGALSEREREVRFRLALVGRPVGKGDSEVPL